MYSTITTTSKQVLVWALMFTLVLSVFPTAIADENDDEWFWDIEENVTDEDGDGSDDTIEIGYDPDTTCDCDINITVYVDIYDENGYVEYIYDYHTIYDGEGDWFTQDWTPDYSGTFDFYVEMYDEWDNYEDNWSVTGIELEPMTGSSDETINVDNQVGDYHDDGINNDFGMFAFIKNDAVEDVEVEVEYFNGVIWVYYANGTTDDSGEFIVENATTGEYRWTAEYDGEGLEEETVSYTEVDTVSNLSHAVGVDDWDGAGDYDDFFAYVFEGDDTKDDAYIEIYDEDGDLYDSGNTDYDYYGFDIYVIYDVEKGNYTFDFYYEEDGELLQSGWLYSYGSTSTNYDEWFEDWDYETEDTNGDGVANSITTSYDPDTECNCTIDIEVDLSVYNNDTGDYAYSNYYDHEINGTDDDWFETDDWSPNKDGNYTFEFYLYDEDWNYEDHFNFTVYLECDEDSNDSDCDVDEWFEDWDYDTESTDDDNLDDTINVDYDPDTDCDCEVNVYVYMDVYENASGNLVDYGDSQYHEINGTEEEYFTHSWTSRNSTSYDFNVYMYDDNWNYEDEFWVYNVFLYAKSGAGGPGDDDEWFDWIDAYTYDNDDDGYDDTAELDYDPDTTCECDINITLYIDIYDNETGYWVNGTEENYTIYSDDDDYWYQEWSPEYNGTFDFYVELYDEDGNLEDEEEYMNISLHTRSSGGGGDGDDDEWFYSWDHDVDPSDTINIGYDPDTECDCYVNITVYVDVYDNVTDDWVDWTYDDHTIYSGYSDWFEQDWTASNDGTYDFWVNLYDGDGNEEDDFWIYDVYLSSDGGGGNGSDDDEWFQEWDYDVYPSDTINIGYDPDTECDCYVDIEVYVDIFDNQTGDYVDSLYDDHTIYNGEEDWFVQDWTAYYEGTYDFRVELYDQEYGHEEDEFWIYDVYLSSDGGGGDGEDDIGSLAEIADDDDDSYVNDYRGAVTEDGDWRYEAYFEIYDENGNFVDAGQADAGLFVSDDLDEGAYSHYIYYDEGAEDSIHYGIFYSYGESSGEDSGIINVDMAVMEDDNEDGYPNIFCGGGPCDDALFKAHEGHWDNGISDVVIEIYEYDSGTGETEHYDTVYTNDTGDAISYDHPCGEYVWNATYSGDEIDKGYYQVWAGCDGTGGGGDDDYDEWFYDWDYYGTEDDEWNKLIIGYDPDTECDCDVDIEVYIDVVDNETGDYLGSLYDDHTIYNEEGDWFEQEWTADYAGKYDFYVELYDQEYGHPEDSFKFSLIMSDEWFDSDFHQEDATVYIDLDPQTDYEGEIGTHYYLEVFRLNENDEWEMIDDQVIHDIFITGSNDNENIHFEWTAEEDGKYQFRIWMEDEYWNGEDWDEFETEIVSNHAPVIEDLNVNMLFEGQMFDFEVDAFDEDGDELEYTWDMGDGSSKKEGDSVRYGYQDDGFYVIKISVSDGEVTTVKEFEIEVQNLAPILEVSFDDEADEGSELSFAAQVHDVASDDVTVTWTFADGSRVVGTFAQYTFRDNGEYLVVVVAEDEDGGTTMQQLLVTINNVAPAFTQFVMPSGAEEGEVLDFMVSATDPGDDTITYTFDFGDGTAIMMTPDGNISHKFADGDTFTIVICAQDEDGGESCRTETLPVSILEQLEDSGLPGFGLLGALSALGVIGMLRRRTH